MMYCIQFANVYDSSFDWSVTNAGCLCFVYYVCRVAKCKWVVELEGAKRAKAKLARHRDAEMASIGSCFAANDAAEKRGWLNFCCEYEHDVKGVGFLVRMRRELNGKWFFARENVKFFFKNIVSSEMWPSCGFTLKKGIQRFQKKARGLCKGEDIQPIFPICNLRDKRADNDQFLISSRQFLILSWQFLNIKLEDVNM